MRASRLFYPLPRLHLFLVALTSGPPFYRPLELEQNGILECPSAMHPKTFFFISWILMVFNISYQDTGILNFEDEGESSGPLLAVLARWSSGVALPYAFQTPGAAFSPNISVPASGVIVHKCTSIMVFTVSFISLRPLIFFDSPRAFISYVSFLPCPVWAFIML